jgi:alpha-glucosidase (family GH31 glycosyl hydrolase)
MSSDLNRRRLLGIAASGAGALFSQRVGLARPAPIRVTGKDVLVRVSTVTAVTARITILEADANRPTEISAYGSLLHPEGGTVVATLTELSPERTVAAGDLSIRAIPDRLAFTIRSRGSDVQTFAVESETGSVRFTTGQGHLFGLGEGGPQFDRRGSLDEMRSGQGGYELHTHGGRVPIPWLIGTSGWALFVHHPYGIFDLRESDCVFRPSSTTALPLDIFVVASSDPATILSEYAGLTGHPEMPPLWSLGYQQSHRTLAGRDEVLSEAKTFREKKLPCDAMIYLGTGFCPSGWNTENGSFVFNRSVFPNPTEVIDKLHHEHFKVVLHGVILSDRLRGNAHDQCTLSQFDEAEAGCYWAMHHRPFAAGVDGWWPDEGDPLDVASRLTRIRMYWEGPQIDRPNERPYALHRNGCGGMQRYGAFLWSGDVYSTWETLRTHVPIGINAGLSGIPYWGTDIGGFVPTKELTGELYVRWFQFGAFCPLFRSHGRTWKLRLPWGWNTGELGPDEVRGYSDASNPDPRELHNAAVEPICRKYLELRYRLLPYTYSVVRECCLTGMSIMRAMWLHYPNDPEASRRGDQYLWGRSILVAPVCEKAATERRLYLPQGQWFDFWDEKVVDGGKEITRPVTLDTLPLYVKAGSIVPFGPVKQWTGQPPVEPTTLLIYPGADASFLLYEDDGHSFDFERGQWMGTELAWNDSRRVLSIRLAPQSKVLSPVPREFRVRVIPSPQERTIQFRGNLVESHF